MTRATTEAPQLRTLLGAVAEVLDVPLGDDIDEARTITRDRAVMVRAAILGALDGAADPAMSAKVLRNQAAADAPLPGTPEYEAAEAWVAQTLHRHGMGGAK